MSKLYPVGVQNFEKVILGGYEYVDKTALIYQLFNTGSYYFLSRPRRFGKSLLLSTLEAYAQGKKELFKGLALEKLEKDWTVYPVLHLDLNTQKYDTPESLTSILNDNLCTWESRYGARESETSLSLRFQGIIRRACEQTGRRVVILIDEYDKPMLQAIGNEALQNEYRSTLKAFYGALKSMDGCIRFALLTGVTKFGKVSVFSDLNNLMDISMDDRYVEICGISEKEIHTYFEEDIHALATATGLTYEETCAELKSNYDGYHFTENAVGMYNPFSLDYYEDGSKKFFNCTKYDSVYKVTPSACNKIFKREIINNIRFLNGLWYEDFNFTTKILLNDPKISTISGLYYNCHARKVSTMNNNNSIKNLDIITVIEDLKDYACKNNLFNEDIFKYLIFDHILITSINRVSKQKNKDKNMVITKLRNYCKENLVCYKSQNFYKSIPLQRKFIATLNYHGFNSISKLLLKIKSKIR